MTPLELQEEREFSLRPFHLLWLFAERLGLSAQLFQSGLVGGLLLRERLSSGLNPLQLHQLLLRLFEVRVVERYFPLVQVFGERSEALLNLANRAAPGREPRLPKALRNELRAGAASSAPDAISEVLIEPTSFSVTVRTPVAIVSPFLDKTTSRPGS